MKHILVVLTALIASACTTHRLPSLPPERDPTSESAPVTPWRAPPDVLHGELNDGAAPPGGHEMHDMPGMQHDMPGMKHDMKDMPGMQHGEETPRTQDEHAGHGESAAPAPKKEAP